jgi:hypothetical protein
MINEIKINLEKRERNERRQKWYRGLLKREIKKTEQKLGMGGEYARQCLTSLVCFLAHTLVPSTHP